MANAMSLPLFIGLRYVRARSGQFFVSFISWVSMIGICVGVLALITILSVMNGFENEFRARLLSLAAHATLTGNAEQLARWPELVGKVRQQPGVTGVAPFVELQALIAHEPELQPGIVRGIDPALEPAVSEIPRALVRGRLDQLQPGSSRVILGRVLAYQLGVGVGDSVTVMIPIGGVAGDVLSSRIQRFTVSGIFEVGLQEEDGVLALVHLDDALALRGAPGITGLRLRFADAFAAPVLAERSASALGGGFHASDWTREHASYFRAIRIEKTMMTLIMMLIVAVAVFNIVAMLVMVVTDKRTDIAILRTIGARPHTIVGIFMTQGVVIGWLGTALGIAAGIAIALNVDTLAPLLERTFGFQIMDADVFYISRIPSDLQAADVLLIGTVSFLLSLLATIYPAIRAARTQPAEALRYE